MGIPGWTGAAEFATLFLMAQQISRRGFVKSSLIASAAVPLGLGAPSRSDAQTPATPAVATVTPPKETLPTGKMGGQEFSRLIMGGNLFGGWSHSRDLAYVSNLMRRYNTEAKIRETLELAEAQGVTAINTYVMQENAQLFNHWKCGGKMKWFAQVRLDANGGYSQIQKAVDEGATGIHVNGDAAEGMLSEGKFEKVGEMVQLIKSKKRVAGVGAHDLRVIIESEKAKLDVDFYQKTFHSHDYFTAPRPGEKDAMGPHDNSWCNDPQAVIDFMATVKKPWVAFKILAAGAIQPRAGFPYAFNSGADFILVGMFDWQIEEDTKLARRVFAAVTSPDSKRTRPWYS
jgi:hypothetical protein